jgi:hypothetical protein
MSFCAKDLSKTKCHSSPPPPRATANASKQPRSRSNKTPAVAHVAETSAGGENPLVAQNAGLRWPPRSAIKEPPDRQKHRFRQDCSARQEVLHQWAENGLFRRDDDRRRKQQPLRDLQPDRQFRITTQSKRRQKAFRNRDQIGKSPNPDSLHEVDQVVGAPLVGGG